MIHDEIVLDLLQRLDTYKSMGPDGLRPTVLRELAGVVAKTLSIIFLEVLANRRCPSGLETGKCDTHLQKGPKR